MPTATENRQPTPLSPLKRLVVHHPVAAFLVMLYAIAWTVFLPVVLQARGLLALPVDLSEGIAFDAVTSLASILGVALPAFIVTAATGGKAGMRELLRRCLRWRVGIVWYLAALFGLLAVMVLVGSVLSDPAPLEVLTERWSLIFTLFLPEVLFPFLFIQIFEEAGWTGFMQHTLQERRVPLLASILVAPAFVLQHLPILLMDAGVGLTSLIIVGASDSGGILPGRRHVALQRQRAQRARRSPLPQRLQLGVGHGGSEVHRRADPRACRDVDPHRCGRGGRGGRRRLHQGTALVRAGACIATGSDCEELGQQRRGRVLRLSFESLYKLDDWKGGSKCQIRSIKH
jgi:membrane protease YdiL (CAAX protease family)